MGELDYWDRLTSLQMASQERRRERYSIIFVWKIAEQLVKGYSVSFSTNPRRGRLANVPVPPQHVAPAVRKARDGSLRVKGAKLFNIIPKELRDMTGTVEQFKAGLDQWLSSIPDQPTVAG